MNFIVIVLAENMFYNKFSASIEFLNAMHVKAKYSLLYISRSSTPAQTPQQFTLCDVIEQSCMVRVLSLGFKPFLIPGNSRRKLTYSTPYHVKQKLNIYFMF